MDFEPWFVIDRTVVSKKTSIIFDNEKKRETKGKKRKHRE